MQIINPQLIDKNLYYDSGIVNGSQIFNLNAIFNNVNLNRCYVKIITYDNESTINIAYGNVDNIKERYKLSNRSIGYILLPIVDTIYLIIEGTKYQIKIKGVSI